MPKTIEERLIELAEAHQEAKTARRNFAIAFDNALSEKIKDHIEFNNDKDLDYLSIYIATNKGDKYNYLRDNAFEDVSHIYSKRVKANIKLGAKKGALLRTGRALLLKQNMEL